MPGKNACLPNAEPIVASEQCFLGCIAKVSHIILVRLLFIYMLPIFICDT